MSHSAEPTPDPLTAADYAEMADSYEREPPRKDEVVGEPFVTPRSY